MTEPLLVVHITKDPFDARVDRATKWGNPFKIGTRGTREEVLREFYHYLFFDPKGQELLGQVHQLHGYVLGCWCAPKGGLSPALPPHARCHAQILAWHALYDPVSEIVLERRSQ